jgi:Terminase large subunit, T4likevirus-type, N-terminal/Terminase RNaseH-like domain
MADDIKQLLASPTWFSAKILGIKPTKYQAFLLEEDKNCIVIWGRQCGKTTTLAIKALHRAIVRKNQEILIIAPTQRQAKLMFDKIFGFCDSNDFVKAHTKRLTLSDIELDSGSRIHCLPAGHEGMNIRGFSATMIIFDEAALIPDAVFLAIRPSMAVRGDIKVGGQLVMSGTPYGKRGFFYNQYRLTELRKESAREWEIFKVRASESPIIEPSFLEEMKATMTTDQYMQEFEAEFVADSNAFFPYSLVVPAMDDYQYVLPTSTASLPREAKLVMGVDVARTGSDETAITICQVTSDEQYKVLWSETHGHSLITETAGRVVELAGLFPDMKIYIDETGLGAGALDIIRERNVDITGITFTPMTRSKMYSNVKLALEQRRLKFSTDDRKLAGQFSNYSGKQGSDGSYRIVKGDAHDDCVDSLSLCFCGIYDLEWDTGFPMQLNPVRQRQDELRVKWAA